MKSKIILFHFKRDLRLNDNAGLFAALKRADELTKAGQPTEVLGLFIFDTKILNQLQNKQDRRVCFIHYQVHELKKNLQNLGSDLTILYGDPREEIQSWMTHQETKYQIIDYYTNFDDDPYPLQRDAHLKSQLTKLGLEFKMFKDHLIFSRDEILTQKQKPYTVFTPYKKAWLLQIQDPFYLKSYPIEKYFHRLLKYHVKSHYENIESLGFQNLDISTIIKSKLSHQLLQDYSKNRDFPFLDGTSHLGIHLRFGTVSPRALVREALPTSEVFVSELIWRDFFAQILFHFPHVVTKSFNLAYENIQWRNSPEEFQAWKEGRTGYPFVDAGMRELLATGSMHNRVRMIVASFLCKHLLHHWHCGERYFAQLLLDYDLASNNGNWQWAAGTGCDAAPYFRIFNPEAQREKFDPKNEYIKKWVPEFGTAKYPKPMVDHAFARARALDAYKKGLSK